MGLLSDLFSLLVENTDNSYVYSNECWFDNLWKKMYRPYTAKGVLELKEGRLFKKFYVLFPDDTGIVIVDDNDEGQKLRHITLSTEHKRQLLRDGFITIKKYG